MSLDKLRHQIDHIDSDIVKLIAERIKTAEKIGQQKQKENRRVEDREREAQVLEKVSQAAAGEGISPEDIMHIYREIISISRNRQGIQVAVYGESGSNTEQAAFYYFGQGIQPHPCASIDDVFKAVQQEGLPYGIIPVENSQEGTVSRSYDLLLDSDVMVSGELNMRISHCLIANPGTRLADIKTIYSHPQALGQCQALLKHLNCELIPTINTSTSVKMIKEKKIMDGAAVASARAAEIYEMEILAQEIEDNPRNSTRFFVLSKKDSDPTGEDKTSIVFLLKHRPGSLFTALKAFADRKINLTKIESRPTRQTPWEYNFYIDIEGHRTDKIIQEALQAVDEVCLFLKVLGSYPRWKQQ